MRRLLLGLLLLFAGSLSGVGSELAHAALGALDSLGDAATGALHCALLAFAEDGTADGFAGSVDLVCDGGGGG